MAAEKAAAGAQQVKRELAPAMESVAGATPGVARADQSSSQLTPTQPVQAVGAAVCSKFGTCFLGRAVRGGGRGLRGHLV